MAHLEQGNRFDVYHAFKKYGCGSVHHIYNSTEYIEYRKQKPKHANEIGLTAIGKMAIQKYKFDPGNKKEKQ